MVKQGWFFAGLIFFFAGCTSTTPILSDHPINFSPAKVPSSVEHLWSLKIEGQITDLNLSATGNAVLVATQPDHDSDRGGGYAMLLVNADKGKLEWRNEMEGLIKAQSISADGSLIVISNYDEEIQAFNRKGKHLWTSEATCKPMVLDEPKRILCFHDDDGEPDVAFDVFDFEGKKLSSFPIHTDVLLLKVAADQKTFVAAFAGGGVTLFRTKDFKPVWRAKAAGEIADVAVSSGSDPKVFALYKPRKAKGGQRIVGFDSKGKIMGQVHPSVYAEQIESAHKGTGVVAYGNGPQGQSLSFTTVPGFQEGWSRRDKRFADYSSQMISSGDLVLVGFENTEANSRRSHLLIFDLDGGLKADIPLQTEEGAYIYAQGYSAEASLLAVGTDDGTLSGYRLTDQAAGRR